MATGRFRLAAVSRDLLAAHDPALADAAARAIFVAGAPVEAVLRLADAAAMTLGRYVLVRRDLLLGPGPPFLPAWLVAHELTHVAQYDRSGAVVFLAGYLGGYVRGLRGLGRLARHGAYRAIPAEMEARAAETGLGGAAPLGLEPV